MYYLGTEYCKISRKMIPQEIAHIWSTILFLLIHFVRNLKPLLKPQERDTVWNIITINAHYLQRLSAFCSLNQY